MNGGRNRKIRSCRLLKKAVQQGRSERRPSTYPLGYVEGLNDARTMLAGFFSSLLACESGCLPIYHPHSG
jgi:hypothetical protein